MATVTSIQAPATRVQYRDFLLTGPGTLAGRYLRRFWQPVYVAEELPPGRAVTVRILGEDLTLYRGEGGAPHLVGFRCAHRGTQLSVGWVEEDCIRCLYHGWKFDGAGQCVDQPAEPEPFAAKVRIAGYPTQEYIGLIFAYLGEGEPPPLPRYEHFEDPDSVYWMSSGIRNCNAFQNIENSADIGHLAFAHARSLGFDYKNARPRVGAEETSWGVKVWLTRPDGRRQTNHVGMPNIVYIGTNVSTIGKRPDSLPEIVRSEGILFKVPVDDTHHMRYDMFHAKVSGEARQRLLELVEERKAQLKRAVPSDQIGEAVLAGTLRVDDVEPPSWLATDLAVIEDEYVQVGQGRMWDAGQEQEHLGREDVGVIVLRKIWETELKALAEGRPLRQWVRPPDMLPGWEWAEEKAPR
jgi:5,5'-dehydrodivanillate O-demethylase